MLSVYDHTLNGAEAVYGHCGSKTQAPVHVTVPSQVFVQIVQLAEATQSSSQPLWPESKGSVGVVAVPESNRYPKAVSEKAVSEKAVSGKENAVSVSVETPVCGG